MRILANLSLLLWIAVLGNAQTANTPPAAPAPASNGASAAMASDLDRLQAAASQANVDLSHMRVEKWKADGDTKRQAQSNSDSLQRNLTSALPGLIEGFRTAPQDLTAGFKLYRNLNALYDVLVSFTESAGAFGPKSDYEALAQQVNIIDGVRRDLGDQLEKLSASTQGEVNQLRLQLRTLQEQQAAAQAAAGSTAKKVVVDNSETPKKTSHKKKPSTSGSSGADTSSGAKSTPPTPPPKTP